MRVYPVRYKAKSESEIAAQKKRFIYPENSEGTYFIVAPSIARAEEIAFSCIAAFIYPQPEVNERSIADGRIVANVWVMDEWSAPTECKKQGIIGTGSEKFCAKAYANYVGQTGILDD